jgi:hypothetical protein
MTENHVLWVHIGHMGTRLRLENMNIRLQCQWIKHPNGVNVDNYRLTLVDLKILGHKDDQWVLADHVAQVFYVLDPETEKYIVVSRKQKIVRVDNVKDKEEGVNQCEEISLFTNPMNIKHIEKDFEKNLLLYM